MNEFDRSTAQWGSDASGADAFNWLTNSTSIAAAQFNGGLWRGSFDGSNGNDNVLTLAADIPNDYVVRVTRQGDETWGELQVVPALPDTIQGQATMELHAGQTVEIIKRAGDWQLYVA